MCISVCGRLRQWILGVQYGYRMSKAALNCAGATLARDLRADGIHVAIVHPGAVRGTGSLAMRFKLIATTRVSPQHWQRWWCTLVSFRLQETLHAVPSWSPQDIRIEHALHLLQRMCTAPVHMGMCAGAASGTTMPQRQAPNVSMTA